VVFDNPAAVPASSDKRKKQTQLDEREKSERVRVWLYLVPGQKDYKDDPASQYSGKRGQKEEKEGLFFDGKHVLCLVCLFL
jgi:hypothetical protein